MKITMNDSRKSQNTPLGQVSGKLDALAKQKQTDVISLEEAKNALLRSGYLLESRLETELSKKGYYVDANKAYPDPETGKAIKHPFSLQSVRQCKSLGLESP
jgi:hypothetical protein